MAGATSSTLALSNLHTNLNSYAYQCVVSNAYGMVTSAPPASLAVTYIAIPPIITDATAHLTNYIGNNMIFAAVNADGTQPFTYQWYHGATALMDDGLKYSGSTSASLIVSNLASGDAGNYYLVVSNTVGYASNLVDVLAVHYQLPAINPGGQPQPVTTFVGPTTSLTVTPTGGTLPQFIQWYMGSTAVDRRRWSQWRIQRHHDRHPDHQSGCLDRHRFTTTRSSATAAAA